MKINKAKPMRYFLLLILIVGCQSSTEIDRMIDEKEAMQEEIDSLRKELIKCELSSYVTDEGAIPSLDSLQMNKDTTAYLKKMLQVFKFRENRNRDEKERVRRVIKELISDERKKLDSSSANLIIMDTITRIKD